MHLLYQMFKVFALLLDNAL